MKTKRKVQAEKSWLLTGAISAILVAAVGAGGIWMLKHQPLSQPSTKTDGTDPAHATENKISDSQSDVRTKRYVELKGAAEAGDAQSQYDLYQCLTSGDGVEKNESAALIWLEKSAKAGHHPSQIAMGRLLLEGKGVTKNYDQAADYFQLAANAGLAEAQYLVGFCYETGQGAFNNGNKDYAWYMKSAQQGYGFAQYALSRNRNNLLTHEQCAQWCLKAAEGGVVAAQTAMGIRYAEGDGVSRDFFEANKWFMLASKENVSTAYYYLGIFHKKGLGVQQDKAKAIAMFKKAIEFGYVSKQTAEELAENSQGPDLIVNGQPVFLQPR